MRIKLKNNFISAGKAGSLIIYILAFVLLSNGISLKRYKSLDIIKWDVVSYYAYLPAAFIYKDLSFEFVKDLPEDFEGIIWLEHLPNGKKTLKTSMGMALMYLPFFFMAHIVAGLSGFEQNGYSSPYHFFILLAAIAYLLAALLYLRKILLLYFREEVVAATILVLVLATNLFYYSTAEPGMSHVYSFFLFTAFLFHTISFYKKSSLKDAVLLGVFSALIVLVRPSNIIVLFIFLLFGLGRDIKKSYNLLWKSRMKLLLTVAAGLSILSLQLFFWKYSTGSWFYYSYGEERFYFLHPHIIEGLFSYRKGWLVYTPLMSLAIAGFVYLRKKIPELFFPVLIFSLLNIYIVFSWWCWWYGGGYGARALIESYAFLSLPLAAMIDKLFNYRRWIRLSSIMLLLFFIYLNIFQISQYRTAQLHWDSTSKEVYWASFLNKNWPENWEKMLDPPDYEKALRGE